MARMQTREHQREELDGLVKVGVGYFSRDLCDDQYLASIGRWPPEQSRYPQHESWKKVVQLLENSANTYGLFPADEVKNLTSGYTLRRDTAERTENANRLPISEAALGSGGRPRSSSR